VQTIDCNQDNFLVEALKLPNLLGEFEYQDGRPINVRGSLQKSAKSRCCSGDPNSERRDRGPALVGFREWVFSADSGALAVFAAATERSFGTTVQRVMYNPGVCTALSCFPVKSLIFWQFSATGPVSTCVCGIQGLRRG